MIKENNTSMLESIAHKRRKGDKKGAETLFGFKGIDYPAILTYSHKKNTV